MPGERFNVALVQTSGPVSPLLVSARVENSLEETIEQLGSRMEQVQRGAILVRPIEYIWRFNNLTQKQLNLVQAHKYETRLQIALLLAAANN